MTGCSEPSRPHAQLLPLHLAYASSYSFALLHLPHSRAAEEASNGKIVANAGGVGGREGDAFAAAASRDVFGALTGGAASLEARVSSRKHFNSR